jgi:hypothetical protein
LLMLRLVRYLTYQMIRDDYTIRDPVCDT